MNFWATHDPNDPAYLEALREQYVEEGEISAEYFKGMTGAQKKRKFREDAVEAAKRKETRKVISRMTIPQEAYE